MSFTVQKNLGNSLFRFAVGRRRELKSIDHDTGMSTGASGEFIRHRPEIFYSADLRQIHVPEVPVPRTLSGTSFTTSLFEGQRKGLNIGLLIAGAVVLLLGLTALMNKGSVGIIWIVFALILLAVPIVTTAMQRRAVIQADERKRKEREERDARNRELLDAYTKSLETLRENPNDETLARVLAENEKLDLPYAVWADTAIGTVLYVGFSTLARVGPERAGEVAALMDRSSDAAGLIAEDAKAVKHALYSTILWHFLADDRLGAEQLKIVRAVQDGFAIKPDEVPVDTSSESQFERLRGVDHRNAPRCDTKVPLNLNEWCMYTVPIRLRDGSETNAYVTNKRFIVEGSKQLDIPVPQVDDIHVDADRHFVTLRASQLKRALEFTATDPIYLAAMLDLATRLDDRPKSFA